MAPNSLPQSNGHKLLKDAPFFVVGVGASAGGLEAFSELLHDVPSDSRLAFVLVQHLSPFHESLLTGLLAKCTRLPVSEVVSPTRVQPGHVYVIPPNAEMQIRSGTLQLTERKDREGHVATIDTFFNSLAADRKEWAVGVVMSGSESDGVLGLERIKAEGGFTFAQDEASAKFKDMPRKAAASGMVDFILPPRAIASRLSQLPGRFHHTDLVGTQSKEPSKPEEATIQAVLQLLKTKTGMDFASYKLSTILRRITRRMVLHQKETLEDYLDHLTRHPQEAQALRKDLLINVTSFFRDPASFEFLKTRLLPEIMKRHGKEAPVRIWVPGCSTGNEAYSVAICMEEYFDGSDVQAQIFATDVSESVIESARRGIYPESIRLDVSPQRLERFFHRADGGYQINRSIRDMCIFATHNLLSDPPFSDIDLISCRNVLIYMDPSLQKKAIAFFQYSLKPEGFLVLGGSESIGAQTDQFVVVDKLRKVYSKRPSAQRPAHQHFALNGNSRASSKSQPPSPKGSGAEGLDARQKAVRLWKEKGAAGVLITADMDIVEFFGQPHPCVRPAAGQASLNLLQMVHEDLLPDLCITIYKAQKDGVATIAESLPAGGSKRLDIEVIPINDKDSAERHFLILFGEFKPARKEAKAVGAVRLAAENRRLKQDLVLAKESLMAIMKEQSSVAEEFRSQSEEIQSSNEEFQSTNEELETAKEELQSSNEELTTVNNEMEMRNAELIQTNDDLNNLILSVHTAIMLVDAKLRLRRFTAKAGKNLGLVTADIGRRITDVRLLVAVQDLEALIHKVTTSLEQMEMDVQDDRGCWYLMRVRPYRRQDGNIDGVVIMFIDIMDLKHSMMQLQDEKNYNESIVETLWEPLVVLDSSMIIRSANKSFYQFFNVAKKDVMGRRIYDLGNGQWDIPRLRELLEELLARDSSFYNFEMEHDFPGIGHKLMLLNAHKIHLKEGHKEEIIILAFQDVTEQRHADDALNRIAAELSFSNKELENFASTAAHDLRSPLSKIQIFAERLLGETVTEKGRAYLDTMIKSSQRMGSLVENLLRVSRVASQGHERERVRLEEVVDEVLSDLEIPIQESDSTIERGKLPVIIANRIQMRQLFQNLIGNSIKYRRKDVAPRIQIQSRLTADSIQISFEDNGIGFEEKFAQEIFKPFKRLHGASDYEGSGIGLALCQKIVRHHGGDILVRSRVGEGTTFTLELPVKLLTQSDVAEPSLPPIGH